MSSSLVFLAARFSWRRESLFRSSSIEGILNPRLWMKQHSQIAWKVSFSYRSRRLLYALKAENRWLGADPGTYGGRSGREGAQVRPLTVLSLGRLDIRYLVLSHQELSTIPLIHSSSALKQTVSIHNRLHITASSPDLEAWRWLNSDAASKGLPLA